MENNMFAMEQLDRIIVNACKEGVMYMKSDDVRVDTEVTRRNMQLCIPLTKKKTKWGKGFGDSA